ncbi:unnamed protein product [Closterium sp. NIES-53]
MIDGGNVYRVFCAIVPLYVGIGSGFLSVRVFKILSPDQCAGINRYIAFIALPSLVFQVRATHRVPCVCACSRRSSILSSREMGRLCGTWKALIGPVVASALLPRRISSFSCSSM